MQDFSGSPLDGGPRSIQRLATGWRFSFGEESAAWQTDFDDADWQVVDLPHTWNEQDGVDGDNAYRRGPGFYRLRFQMGEGVDDAGRRFYLRFDGVSMVATVWLNGRELGTHFGASSAFCFDVTAALEPDVDNVLVVRADNSWRDDVPPREGDFTMFGGVYRGVTLVGAPALSIDMLDHASDGVYLTTPVASAERGVVRARVRLRNAQAQALRASVSLTLMDNFAAVSTARVEQVVPPGVTETELVLAVERPRRWNGRVDPHLYQAVVEVATEGRLLDRVELPLGFRTFRFDPEQGFLLNERPYDLHGVNLHEDWEGRGRAVDAARRDEDFRLICEMGCTFVRLVHYQHDQLAHDLCDRLGLIVWAEHGLVNTVSPDPAFADRCAFQLVELIRQSFNHPSIVTWGIGNEVQAREPWAKELLCRLSRTVAAEDPTRLSVLATCFDEPPGEYENALIAHNKYFGWYLGSFADFPRWLDDQRQKDPARCQGISEYGAGAGPSLHAHEPKPQDHSEEHQGLLHEAYWRALRVRPWVWCKAIWQMFDTASDGRNEGERPGVNDKGLVTRDRQTKKDAYYWYKANWTGDPFVYITSRRFTPRAQPSALVKVYSNCDEVAAWLNGLPLGTRPVDDHVATFAALLAPGENHVEVHARKGHAEVIDSCVWTLT